jgi:RluA family pseudouridine synthase
MAHKRLLTAGRDDPPLLLPFLVARLGLGPEQGERLLREGAVYVGRERVQKPRFPLSPGARVVVYLGEPPGAADAAAPRIRLADEDVLVIEKPAGLLVQPGRAGGPSLLAWLEARGEGAARLVSRLDREVSGLILLARRGAACAPLQAALSSGAIQRGYHAVVQGPPQPPEGRIDLRIGRGGEPHRRVALPASAPAGAAALTEYRTEALLMGGRALVSLRLLTGRTHQIRVHLAAIGHPIVGDRDYGGPPAERLMLHASALRFPHPGTGALVEITSPPPWQPGG